MVSKIDKEKVELYINAGSIRKEDQNIYSLFSENEYDSNFQQFIKDDFFESLSENFVEEIDLLYLLDRIHHLIQIKENKKKQTSVKIIYRWFPLAAAVLFASILLSGIFRPIEHKSENEIINDRNIISTIYAPFGSRISFNLPDGTKVWLNSGSSLDYCLPFSNNRNVTVLGEAWFDVSHAENQPFVITAGDSKIKVLGTKFNLSAYPEEKYVEVALEEGNVEFSTPGLASPVEMKANERLIFNDGAININNTDVSKYSAWKEGKMVFRGDSMGEVARRIERWYNVEVKLVDKELDNYIFRGTFQDDSLEEVLRYLSMTSPIKYQIIDRKLLDDGIVQKKRIFLSLKN